MKLDNTKSRRNVETLNLIIFEFWIEKDEVLYETFLAHHHRKRSEKFGFLISIFSYACFSLLSGCVLLIPIVIWSRCVKYILHIFLWIFLSDVKLLNSFDRLYVGIIFSFIQDRSLSVEIIKSWNSPCTIYAQL